MFRDKLFPDRWFIQFLNFSSNLLRPPGSLIYSVFKLFVGFAIAAPGSLIYSVFKLFVGFAIAARMAWNLTVNMAIRIAINPASANIHQVMVTR